MANIYLRITAQNGTPLTDPVEIIVGQLTDVRNVPDLTDSDAAIDTAALLRGHFETYGFEVETVNPDHPSGVPPVKL